METTGIIRVYIGIIEYIYWGYIGITEKTMETTIDYPNNGESNGKENGK